MVDDVYWLTLLGWYHLVVFTLFVPALAMLSRRRFKAGNARLASRVKHFRSTAFMLALFGSLSVLTAVDQDLDLFSLALRRSLLGSLAAIVMYVVAVAAMRPRWRQAVARRRPIVQYFMPQTSADRAWWIAVSILAGVSEEITWRGVQPALLAYLTDSPTAGVVVTAILFGVGHSIQGWKSAALIILFALCFQGVVWISGSLYPAMIAHAAYDITAGLTYARLGRELGYVPEGAPSPSGPSDPAGPTGPEGSTGPAI